MPEETKSDLISRSDVLKALNEYGVCNAPQKGRYDYKMQHTIFDTIQKCMEIVERIQEVNHAG